jgi:hypothetical protein
MARLGNPFALAKEIADHELNQHWSRFIPTIARWMRTARRSMHDAELILVDGERSPDAVKTITADCLTSVEHSLRVLTAIHGDAETARLVRRHLQTELGRIRGDG